jgi:hypothetical protein
MEAIMNRKRALFSLVTILVLSFSLLSPSLAWAEDELPPDPGTAEPPAETAEPVAAPETLAQDPETPDMIVVDSEDQALLLVSEEAAAVLGNSDPVWCPGTDTPGSSYCTSNQASVTDLIAYLLDPDSDPLTETPYKGAGTIYFQDGDYGPESLISFDNMTLAALTDIALEGGWNLVTNTKVHDGLTVFNAPMYLDWDYAVEMKDILITAVYDGYSLYIVSDGDVTLHNVSVDNNLDIINGGDGSGAYIDTCIMADIDPDPDVTEWGCSGTGSVTIVDSTFDENAGDGLWVEAGGAINLTAVSASDNDFYGAALDNSYGSGDVTISGGTFSENGFTGLDVRTEGAITIDHIMADLNQDGADLDAGDAITVVASYFSENQYGGLWGGTSHGDITLLNVTASLNMLYGAVVGTDEGNIDVVASWFTDNSTLDPEAYGDGIGIQAGTLLGYVNLELVTASGNDIGAMAGSMDGDVTIFGGEFIDNTWMGLEAGTGSGTLVLVNVTAGNTPPPLIVPLVAVVSDPAQEIGAHLANLDGQIMILGGFFDGNLQKGLYIESTGGIATPVFLSGVEAVGNGSKGAYISYLAPCGTTTGGVSALVTGGLYQTNGAYGIYAMVGPEGDLNIDTIVPPDFGTDVDTWNGTPPDSLYGYFVNTDVIACPPPCEPEPKVEPKPYNVVEVPATGGMPVEQDCANYSGTILVLSNNDRVILSCPAVGMVDVKELAESELPGDLPGGPTFISALEITLMDGDTPIPVITNGGYITVAFQIPEDARPNDRFSILYWDPAALDGAGDWVELPEYREVIPGTSTIFPLHPDADPDDLMRILAGTHAVGGHVKADVNFPGVFVLIKR